jgi:hypothetical protein
MYRFPNQEHDPVPVVFGCEDSETGEIYKQQADGLLGISKASTAFHRQLVAAGAVEDVFSLCFGYPKGGALSFGEQWVAAETAVEGWVAAGSCSRGVDF